MQKRGPLKNKRQYKKDFFTSRTHFIQIMRRVTVQKESLKEQR